MKGKWSALRSTVTTITSLRMLDVAFPNGCLEQELSLATQEILISGDTTLNISLV